MYIKNSVFGDFINDELKYRFHCIITKTFNIIFNRWKEIMLDHFQVALNFFFQIRKKWGKKKS